MSLDWSYTVKAKFISVDDMEFDKVNKDDLKDKLVTIESKENKKQIKIKFHNLTSADQAYVIEQLKNQTVQ
jgi:hypothetical protein